MTLTTNERIELIDGLHSFLEHGDLDHSAWLHEAIHAYFFALPKPPVRGSGNKEALIAKMQAELELLRTDSQHP